MIIFISTLFFITILIFLNSLFVAAEFATVSARRTRVSQIAGAGNPIAKMLLPILEDSKALDKYVAACQLGITASSLVLGAFGQNYIAVRLVEPLTRLLVALEPVLGSVGITSVEIAGAVAGSISVIGVLILLTILQVVVGELLPKSVAIQYPEKVALWTAAPVTWSLYLMRPLIWFFNGSGNLILRLLGLDRGGGHNGRAHSPAEIEILVTESHEGGFLND
jgi:CBS domain containing-hemolysin-like protein